MRKNEQKLSKLCESLQKIGLDFILEPNTNQYTTVSKEVLGCPEISVSKKPSETRLLRGKLPKPHIL